MALVLEKAGSRLAGWVDYCLACLVSASNDDERFHHEQTMREWGDEREMRICHHPPHLIPPMELGAPDDPRGHSRPYQRPLLSRTAGSMDRTSRTSSRPSLLLKRHTAATRISGPSDFRRVESLLLPEPEPFSPLHLSIHSPGNRLSDLPNFEDFQVDETHLQPIAPPPRVLSLPQRPCSRSYRPGMSYQFLQKPVRSGVRQSSIGILDQTAGQRATFTHPLIPHFSIRTPISTAASENENMSPVPRLLSTFTPILNDEHATMSRGTQTQPTAYKTSSATMEENRPLPAPPMASLSSSTQRRSPQTPEYSKRPTSSSQSMRSASLTTYCFSTATTKPPSSSLYSGPTPPRSIISTDRDRDKNLPHAPSRRLSGSTLASSPSLSSWSATGGGGGFRKTSSLSSSVTPRPSFQDLREEKEAEAAVLSRPYVPKYINFPTPPEKRAYTTIYDGPQPQPQSQQQLDERKYGYNNNRFYSRDRESGIGLAF